MKMFILLIVDLFGAFRSQSVTFRFSLRNASTAYIQKQCTQAEECQTAQQQDPNTCH